MADAVLTQRLVVAAGALALLFLVVFGLLVCLGLFALLGKATIRWRQTRGAHDVGPDSLRLLEDTAADITVYVAEDPDLWDAFGPHTPMPDLTAHPDTNTGLERLRRAVRDEQQKGD